MRGLTVLLVSACAQPSPPRVRIISDDPNLISMGAEAVGIWGALGFHTMESSLPECEENWTDGYEDCQATFRIVASPGLVKINGPNGYIVGSIDRETRVIKVDTEYLTGDRLLHTLAHELGHSLLYCHHLDPDTEHGIMSWRASWLLEPTQDDYDLACAQVGLCVRARPELVDDSIRPEHDRH